MAARHIETSGVPIITGSHKAMAKVLADRGLLIREQDDRLYSKRMPGIGRDVKHYRIRIQLAPAFEPEQPDKEQKQIAKQAHAAAVADKTMPLHDKATPGPDVPPAKASTPGGSYKDLRH